MNWWMIFSAGLLAGATTCAATQGGLLVGLIARNSTNKSRDARSLSEDAVPVTGFLTGKLISHFLLGAILGSLGSIFSFDARFGGILQWVAGVVMLVLGLGTLGVPGFRDIRFNPPASWSNLVRRNTKNTSASAPFLLGLSTVAIPCGVTISIELIAATSGSAITGAAVMSLFVIGTAPMFAVFGVAAARYRDRLKSANMVLGAVVVALALFTINSGLVALGSPVSFQTLLGGSNPNPTTSATVNAANSQVIDMDALNNGFSPSVIAAQAGVPTKLVFHTDNVHSCILSVVIPALGIQTLLQPTGETEVDLGKLEPGDLRISCSMGMYTATIQVQA